MPQISQHLDRIQTLLQDDGTAFSRPQVLEQHQLEMTRLARERRVGNIIVQRAIQDQALYSLPTTAVALVQILYNGRRLVFATEEFLDRKYALWEWPRTVEPKYWTTDNQNPDTVRIVPAPKRSGSTLPVIPPAPFVMSFVDNLVFFLYQDFSDQADNEDDALPLMDIWEDVLVFRTTQELAQREGPYQNMPLSATARALAELWLRQVEL